jgi:hypothetical protein
MRLPAILVALCTVALGGCGPFSSPDEAAKVRSVLRAVFTRNEPETCTKRVTGNFLQATYDGTPETAVDACLSSQRRGGETASQIRVTSLRIDGGHAMATVQVTGGPLDGQTVDAGLVQQFGWRLDSLRKPQPPPSPKEVRKIAEAAVRKGLIEAQGYTPRRADCFVRYLHRKVSDAALAEDLKELHAGSTPRDFAIAAKRC